MFGRFEIVKYLVERWKCDLNISDGDGLTALFISYQFEHYQITKYLWKQGASVLYQPTMKKLACDVLSRIIIFFINSIY